MGVMKLFSSDSSDYGCSYSNLHPEETVVRVNSTPDPTKFKILEQDIVNGYPILLVQYPDVSNYEGIKILMYGKNFNLEKIKNRIDPHFFTDGDSPIARFEPTDYGFNLAQILANSLK